MKIEPVWQKIWEEKGKCFVCSLHVHLHTPHLWMTCISDRTTVCRNFFPEVSVLEYAESHATEIKDFSKILKVEPSGQNVAQKVPRHMRRRAMGHDVRRLPRSIRSMVNHLFDFQTFFSPSVVRLSSPDLTDYNVCNSQWILLHCPMYGSMVFPVFDVTSKSKCFSFLVQYQQILR